MLIGNCFTQIVSGLLAILSILLMKKRFKAVVFGLGAEKASGPDGFSILFFQRSWDLVKTNILQLFGQLYNGCVDLWCLNYALIALIPKKEGACLINEFWPISLLNAIIKIITKVLVNRLRPHIHLLVDQVQSAFTKNRYILDSVACAHEIIAATHNYDIEAVFLKLDFEKAFDSVSLDFLFELLRARRFGQWWIDWINICLFSGTSSILVNGKLGNYIKCRKGL